MLLAYGGAIIGDSLAHSKKLGWGYGRSSSFNNREELSYYGYKGARLCDVNDDNIWDVGTIGGVGHTEKVKGSGRGFGDQTIQLS